MAREIAELRDFLSRQVPEYRAVPAGEHLHILDARIEDWIQVLNEDVQDLDLTGLRSHSRPIRLRVGLVDIHPQAPDAQQQAAPRDAFCFRDAGSSERFDYWIIVSRMLIHDLYFIFAATDLGPHLLQRDDFGNLGHIDVRDSRFIERGDAENALQMTRIALEHIFLHELAHIIRGHVPYLEKRIQMPRACLCEIGQLVSQSLPYPHLQQTVEIEADTIALGIQMDYAKTDRRPTTLSQGCASSDYVSHVGYVIGILFRVFELWRRHLRGGSFDPLHSSHPHPDVREVVLDSWLSRRIAQDDGPGAQLCRVASAARDEGQKAIEHLGPSFLPKIKYLHDLGKERILEEILELNRTLIEVVRPELDAFVAEIYYRQ